MSPPDITAVMTSHNRAAVTVRCVESLRAAADFAGIEVSLVHVDDGSSDHTSERVQECLPQVIQLHGDGNLFWAGAMRLGLERAYEDSPDYVLWLNDDVVMDESALSALVTLSPQPEDRVIAVGAMRDPLTNRCSYSAVQARRSWRRTEFTRIDPTQAGALPTADSMNGNLVLVPRGVYQRVGGFDPVFRHGMADFDYGLRATRDHGVMVSASTEFLGTCAPNSPSGSFNDPALSLGARWAQMMSPKGLPPREWFHFQRQHGGPSWMVPALAPYVQVLRPKRLCQHIHA